MNPQKIKDALAILETKLADALSNPKPTYSIEGQSVSSEDYIGMLLRAYEKTLELLQKIEPFELRSSLL